LQFVADLFSPEENGTDISTCLIIKSNPFLKSSSLLNSVSLHLRMTGFYQENSDRRNRHHASKNLPIANIDGDAKSRKINPLHILKKNLITKRLRV